jgi:hypothetical protein
MKKIVFIFLLYATAGYGQGWMGKHPSLYALNDSLQLTPLNVGIGTNAPSAQFHTTGSVRLAGITNNNTFNRVLTQDSNGVLFWRNAATLGGGNSWSLTGNAGTNPSTNFLGTTDYNRLVLRTNNVEQATILPNGFTGIGTSTPQVRLHVISDNNPGSMGFPYEGEVFERDGDHKFGIYSTASTNDMSTAGGASVALGYSKYIDSRTMMHPGYEMQYGIFPGNTSYFLRFNALSRGSGGQVFNSYANVLLLDDSGRVGINLFNGNPPVPPTANLHVNGTVRFENLPAGDGCPLVIDALGNVFVSPCDQPGERVAGKPNSTIAKLEEKVSTLEQQLHELRTLVNAMTVTGTPHKSYSVFPNPASRELTITPNVGKSTDTKSAVVRDLSGKIVLDKITFQHTARVTLGQIMNGAYLVSIYDKDNKLIQTERIIVQQ